MHNKVNKTDIILKITILTNIKCNILNAIKHKVEGIKHNINPFAIKNI